MDVEQEDNQHDLEGVYLATYHMINTYKIVVMEYFLTQYNLKAGFNHFVDKGIAAV